MATLNEGEHLFAISLCQASMSILFILIESSTPVAFLVVCLCVLFLGRIVKWLLSIQLAMVQRADPTINQRVYELTTRKYEAVYGAFSCIVMFFLIEIKDARGVKYTLVDKSPYEKAFLNLLYAVIGNVVMIWLSVNKARTRRTNTMLAPEP